MNKFRSQFRRLLTPVAVLLLVVVMAVAAPMASLMGAVRVNAAGVTGSPFSITNLPARYAKVGDDIAKPTFANAELWHANRPMTVGDGAKYEEVGQYEWRFYTDNKKKTPFYTHTIWVTQPEYVITMPDVVPTVAPKDMDNNKLVLPLPEKLTADGEEIKLAEVELGEVEDEEEEEEAPKTKAYKLTAQASLASLNLTDKVTVSDKGVTIDLSSLTADERVGTLQVTYILTDKDNNQLTAKVLSDIEIKNINKSKVTFSSNPSAPSVQNLAFCQEITLTAPTANSAKYEDTTFNVEATTKIIGVKFHNGATQPSNWDKISTTKCDSDGSLKNDFVKIDGLKVTTKQYGWYKFLFHTDTLFGNKSANSDETSGEYWSDAVHIKTDSRSPEFKFVDAYGTEAVGDKTLKIDGVETKFEDIEDKYAKRFPFSTSSSEPATDEQKILVNPKTLTIPAIFAIDNNTASDKLKMTVTVAQVKNKSGQKVSDNVGAVYYNNTYYKDNSYDPTETLKINFDKNGDTKDGDNYIHLTDSEGLYLITLSVEDVAVQKYGNGDAVSNTSPRRTTKYLYFDLRDGTDMAETQYSPTINDFTVSDVYLWEGKTFDFAVPTYNDQYTPTANIAMDYYLVNETSKQIFHLDNDDINAGRMYVDLNKLMDKTAWTKFSADTTKVSIYAAARNFTYLQYEFGENVKDEYVDLTKYGQDGVTLPVAGKKANGLTFAKVAFAMHKETSAVASTVSATIDDAADEKDPKATAGKNFLAGKAVRIKSATASFGSTTDTDGRISVEVYQIKESTDEKTPNTRVAVDVVDDNKDDANKNMNIAAVAFRQKSYEIKNWYFTPRTAGTYQVVVTAKDNASNAIKSYVEEITVNPNSDLVPFSNLSAQANVSGAPDTSLTVGTAGRVVVPNLGNAGDTAPKYYAKDRVLYKANDYADGNKVGYYTITVKGKCDPDCLTGERFIPHQVGTYTFVIDYYLNTNTANTIATVNYVVEVTSDGNDATSAIKLDSEYGKKGKLTNEGGQGTADSPKYAITLPQFMTANHGGRTDFIVDNKTLQDNLEAISGAENDTYKYMYPAIAIPMPNLISGTTTEDVEIIVQKSGYTDKLVSSKTKLPNGKYSVIDQIDDYWVFRPEGKFKNNGANFLASADDTASAVYVVTYKTKSTSLTFNITIGNPVKGELTFGDNFLTYNNGKKSIERNTTPVIDKDSNGKRLITINLKQVKYVGNSAFMSQIARGNFGENEQVEGDHSAEYLWQNARVSVTFEGSTYIATSGWSAENGNQDDDAMTYQFNVTESGTYTVTVSLYNPYVNQTVIQTFDFTIDVTATNKNVNLSTVWGVILVILSVGLLAGVIFYFVKTARETRFLDNPKAPKAKKEKPSKAVKDQKEDVK